MTAPLTREEVQGIREIAASEIVRRLKSPAAIKELTGAQLASLTKDLVKLTDPMLTDNGTVGDTELDFADLVSRLPVPARKEHLMRERAHLEARLAIIDALDVDDDRARQTEHTRRKRAKRRILQMPEIERPLIQVE